MNIWINIFFKIRIPKNYPIWPNIMAISMIKNWYNYNNWFSIPPFRCLTFSLLYPPATIEFISGRFAILFTWVVSIKLINTIWGMPTTLIIAVSSVELWFKFLTTKIPFDPLPNFATNPNNIPLLTTSMLGATIVSTLVVVILASSDWIIPILTCCF